MTGSRGSTGAHDAGVLRTDEFDYSLPAERIAQRPLSDRDASRLLHVHQGGRLDDLVFRDLPSVLQPGDLLVANDTRVRRARLRGVVDEHEVEVLVLTRVGEDEYTCLARPARRLPPGAVVRCGAGLAGTVTATTPEHEGGRVIRFTAPGEVERALEALGEAPLPPYVHEQLADAERYQTVYARGDAASAAAPTAGLHFTPAVLDALHARGIAWTTVRLDIGLATFAPIRVDDVEAHPMHEERYQLTDAAAAVIEQTRRSGGRVIAVGTTVVRVLESCALPGGALDAGTGTTSMFIRPGHEFRAVDGLLTNFHQPRSSLLVLIAALIGRERWRIAYEHALRAGYRFLSFGDCMLCWRAR